jgi:Icc-related predicted phosphoesterase
LAQQRIFFATDIHGSETCFRKFLNAAVAYDCRAIILGGDITGKQLVPIVRHPDGWEVSEGGVARVMETEEARDEAARRARASGGYPAFFTVEERERLVTDRAYREERFLEAILEVMRAWADLAVERLQPLGIECVINLGNDDDPEVARALRESSWVRFAEDDVYDLNGVEVVSWGWSNRTPWHSPREQDEDELEASIMAAAAKARDPEHAIFNLHCPPYNSGLDIAPAVTDDFKVQTRGGTPMTIPVGSTAVRSVIEQVQPLVGLHGHVHDSRGACKLGRTLCINPGSDYPHGILRGVILSIKNGKVKGWTMSNG